MTPVSRQVNYIRNSVKATVDAYDGKVTLYEWDEQRPGPQDLDEGVPRHGPADSDDQRRARWRTCATREDLFKVQRELLANYHVTNAEGVLQRRRLLARAGRPDDRTSRATVAAAVLPDAADARPDAADVLADLDLRADR